MIVGILALAALILGLGIGWMLGERKRSILRSKLEIQQVGLATLEQTKDQLAGTFAKLSQDTLQTAVDQLLQVVKPHLDGTSEKITTTLDSRKVELEHLLSPVREMLEKYRAEVQASEENRMKGYAGLEEQIRGLMDATRATQMEASRLVSALRVPTVRGSWGENTLRNCVELAGMSEFCDFTPQPTAEDEEGRRLRPDMIVRLPNGRVIAVDSKTPIEFYQSACEEPDEGKKRDLLTAHAKNVRKHVEHLSRKEYQASVGETLDFTVMFIAGEQFLSSALITDPTIFEYAVSRKIFLATPTVLLPLLRAVAAGWRAEQSEENARQALTLGIELYNRFVKVFEHIQGVGSSLDDAVRKYNEAIRSLETKLLPKARQLQSFVSSSKNVPELELLERQPLDPPAIPDVLLPVKQG